MSVRASEDKLVMKKPDKAVKPKPKNSFSDFITQPWVAAAFLIFAFVTLILSLREFTTVRGF